MSPIGAPAEITVYTLPWCVHCARAKSLLRRRGLPFQEVDGSGAADFRTDLATLTGGYTVPQIVLDGEPIGGADQLAALDRLGVLAAIAAGDPFPIVREIRQVSPRSIVRWAAARVRGRDDVAAVRRIRVRIDRAGRVVATDQGPEPDADEEEHHGEGMCRPAG